jgi:hypothetical protein
MQLLNYLYENTMFTNSIVWGKESALGAIGGGENVALIKSSI